MINTPLLHTINSTVVCSVTLSPSVYSESVQAQSSAVDKLHQRYLHLPMAMKRSLTFIAVLAEVSINNRLLSSA